VDNLAAFVNWKCTVKIWFAGILACLVVLIAVGSVHAVVLDDFDSLTVGAINGQNGWHADSASAGVGRDFTRDEISSCY